MRLSFLEVGDGLRAEAVDDDNDTTRMCDPIVPPVHVAEGRPWPMLLLTHVCVRSV